jgi:hypothetical protein
MRIYIIHTICYVLLLNKVNCFTIIKLVYRMFFNIEEYITKKIKL